MRLEQKDIFRSVLFTLVIIFGQSCFRKSFRAVTIADHRLEERKKQNILRLMLQSGMYTIVHYGSNELHLENIEIDSIAGILTGRAFTVSKEHREILQEIVGENYGMRRHNKDDILSELNLYISRYKIGGSDSSLMLIPFSAIKRVDINQPKSVKNFASSAAGTLLITAAVTFALVAIACNCPHVKAVGKDRVEFQGSLFPGAIGKSLQRNDLLLMKHVPLNEDGLINIQVANELPEIEFVDQVELFEIDNMPYSALATDANESLVSFKPKENLYGAETQNNKNITGTLQKNDSVIYDFSEPGTDGELNKVYLHFKKSDLKKDPMLFILAKQDKWLENLAEFGFSQLGNKFPLWVKKMNKADPEKYSERNTAKGLSIGVYLKQDQGWKYIGNIENIGTLGYRMKAIPLELSGLKGETIEIKLESAHAFWDIDFVCISDEWSRELTTHPLRLISATDHQGRDICTSIGTADKIYHELPERGNYIQLLFEKPLAPQSYLALKGNGYYNHKRNYRQAPNYPLLKYMRSDQLSYHRVSRMMHSGKDLVRAN